MARILADEHIPVGIVYACQQRRIVLTFNERDFRRLHGENAKHFGILCSRDTDPPSEKKFARHIDSFLKQTPMNSRLEALPPMPPGPAG